MEACGVIHNLKGNSKSIDSKRGLLNLLANVVRKTFVTCENKGANPDAVPLEALEVSELKVMSICRNSSQMFCGRCAKPGDAHSLGNHCGKGACFHRSIALECVANDTTDGRKLEKYGRAVKVRD